MYGAFVTSPMISVSFRFSMATTNTWRMCGAPPPPASLPPDAALPPVELPPDALPPVSPRPPPPVWAPPLDVAPPPEPTLPPLALSPPVATAPPLPPAATLPPVPPMCGPPSDGPLTEESWLQASASARGTNADDRSALGVRVPTSAGYRHGWQRKPRTFPDRTASLGTPPASG